MEHYPPAVPTLELSFLSSSFGHAKQQALSWPLPSHASGDSACQSPPPQHPCHGLEWVELTHTTSSALAPGHRTARWIQTAQLRTGTAYGAWELQGEKRLSDKTGCWNNTKPFCRFPRLTLFKWADFHQHAWGQTTNTFFSYNKSFSCWSSGAWTNKYKPGCAFTLLDVRCWAGLWGCVLGLGPAHNSGMLFRTSLSSADEVRNTGCMVEPGDTDGWPVHMVMTAKAKAEP